ncbi:hypothetical protein [Streptomyces anandii]|uniref:hypothetical protein n=1 Tax=Streptomyces anandii TaxID=285454 RepID=UPI0037BBE3FA
MIDLAVAVSGANMHDGPALKPLVLGIPAVRFRRGPRRRRPGRHRWKIERSIAWLFGYRRLTVRHERKGSHFLAFLGLAAALTCYKKLAKLAT